jgi:hypothetical protein
MSNPLHEDGDCGTKRPSATLAELSPPGIDVIIGKMLILAAIGILRLARAGRNAAIAG